MVDHGRHGSIHSWAGMAGFGRLVGLKVPIWRLKRCQLLKYLSIGLHVLFA